VFVSFNVMLSRAPFIDSNQCLCDDMLDFELFPVIPRHDTPDFKPAPSPTTFDLVEVETPLTHDGRHPDGPCTRVLLLTPGPNWNTNAVPQPALSRPEVIERDLHRVEIRLDLFARTSHGSSVGITASSPARRFCASGGACCWALIHGARFLQLFEP
jgi:hypothetical protein